MDKIFREKYIDVKTTEDFSYISDKNYEAVTDETVTDEYISKAVIEWAKEHLGSKFEFREHQFENIIAKLKQILRGEKMNIIEAPTGAGKSIIAIIIAGVLWDYYEMSSYILVTDIGLFDQYVSDIKRYNLGDEWGWLKGRSNYYCDINGFNFNSAECQTQNISFKVLENPEAANERGFPCAAYCEEIRDRKRAKRAHITLFTYQMYIYEMTMVVPWYLMNGDDNKPPFTMRDLVICDECHKIPDIVQDICAPQLDWEAQQKNFDFIISFHKFISGRTTDCLPNTLTVKDIQNVQEAMFNMDNKKSVWNSFSTYAEQIHQLVGYKDDVMKYICDKHIDLTDKKENKDFRHIAALNSWISNLKSLVDYYKKAINSIGKQGYDFVVVNGTDWKKYKLQCVYDNYLVDVFFNWQAKSQLLLSATVGDNAMFKRSIGATLFNDNATYSFSRIPSTFDFSKSPIYIVPNYRMNYQEKDQNLIPQHNLIETICNFHKGQRGIIHTGSYDFQRKLNDMSTPELQNRLLCYPTSKDKQLYLEDYLSGTDKILAGPSIIEGINLPDDACRFMIIMKVPYASLGDELVRQKAKMIPEWYDSETLKKVIQSIGRGIRHKSDWCITYVIDGSFVSLYEKHKYNLGNDFNNRVQYVQP
jgi:Rad3-related DNA helicase